MAESHQVTRGQQDELALSSHQRASRAIKEGRFKSQILPITLKTRKGETIFDTDEHVRNEAKAEDFNKLRAVFKKDGTVTAGNASGINDAAAAVVLMDGDTVANAMPSRSVGSWHTPMQASTIGSWVLGRCRPRGRR